MSQAKLKRLSRREREIMYALYSMEEAGATDVSRHLADEDGYDSIRVTLSILKRKGYVRHRRHGKRHLYRPTISAEMAKSAAWREFVDTFFQGSNGNAIAQLVEAFAADLTADERERIVDAIEETDG